MTHQADGVLRTEKHEHGLQVLLEVTWRAGKGAGHETMIHLPNHSGRSLRWTPPPPQEIRVGEA